MAEEKQVRGELDRLGACGGDDPRHPAALHTHQRTYAWPQPHQHHQPQHLQLQQQHQLHHRHHRLQQHQLQRHHHQQHSKQLDTRQLGAQMAAPTSG